MRITFYSTQSYDQTYFTAAHATHDCHFLPVALNAETALLAKDSQAVCVFVNDVLNAAVLQVLAQQGVQLVALRCAGYNNVDLAEAQRLGMQVVRVPAYSPHAVAEHTLALILTLNRKTHKAYNRIREGNFSLDRLLGFDLYQKTVGVVGTGKIGLVFCGIMRGLGCRVLAYDVFENPEAQALGVTYVPLPDLLAQADVVSLHCPLNETTHHLINASSLQLMKPGAMLINTGRGALIDTPAVIQSLKSGHLGYLGIDVYEQEDKLFFRDFSEFVIQDELILRLMSFPNVLITAHQAFFTAEAMTEIVQTTFQNIDCFAGGTRSGNELF